MTRIVWLLYLMCTPVAPVLACVLTGALGLHWCWSVYYLVHSDRSGPTYSSLRFTVSNLLVLKKKELRRGSIKQSTQAACTRIVWLLYRVCSLNALVLACVLIGALDCTGVDLCLVHPDRSGSTYSSLRFPVSNLLVPKKKELRKGGQ